MGVTCTLLAALPGGSRVPVEGELQQGPFLGLDWFLLNLICFRLLNYLVATPQCHHWHHAADRNAIDKNFAVHLLVLDVLFGAAHMPDRWPSGYGISGGERPPDGYLRQMVWPFRSRA